MRLNLNASFFTPTQVAEVTGVSRHTVLRWIKNGEMKAAPTPGRHHRVSRKILIGFLRKHRYPIPTQWETPLEVVLVSPDEVLVGLLQEAPELEPADHLLTCSNTYEGLLQVAQHRPAVILLDTRTPRLRAHEFCRAVKSFPDTRGCLVLILGNGPREEDVESLQEAGADRIVFRPVSPKVLLNEIRGLVRRARRHLQ